MNEKEEDLKKKRKDELYDRMKEIKLEHRQTVGNQFKYIRGLGLIRR